VGLMAYPDPRGERNNRMPVKRWSVQVSGLGCRRTRVIWRKLDCLNPNLQMMQRPVRRKDTRYRRPFCDGLVVRPLQPSERGALPSEGNQGHEWDAYVMLGRTTETNAGSILGARAPRMTECS
jgi:hypothetical protein